MEDQDIVREFLLESNENLVRLDQGIVELEVRPKDADLLASIFRAVHSIKGTCGFLGFTTLEGVAHQGENILSQLRSGQKEVNAGLISLVLECIDAIRAILSSIEESGGEGPNTYEDLKSRLEAFAKQESSEPSLAHLPGSVEPADVRVEPSPSSLSCSGPGLPQRSPLQPAPLMLRRRNSRFRLPGTRWPPQAVCPFEPAPASAGGNGIFGRGRGRTNAPRSAGSQGNHLGFRYRHSGRCRAAGQAHEPGGRVGAGPQPDAPIQHAAGGRGAERDLAAPEPDHHRAAGRRHEDAHAAHRSGVEQAAARGARRRACPSASRSSWRWTARDTELDKTIIEAIKDPLTHLVRNSCDHGLEPPEARVAAGKPAQGTITLRAYHEGGQVNIEIRDDGAGIDAEASSRRPIEKGVCRPSGPAA